MNNFIYKEEYKYLTNVCLNLTDACNLACRYCFVEQHPHYMTLDTAKAAVDWLFDNLKIKKENKQANENSKVGITFFGGEPTLLWDEIIVPLTYYLEEKYNNMFDLNITTNGTLLSNERIQFLKDHKIYPLLSIDGAETTQNYNRPCQTKNKNSFDLVQANITKLLKEFPNTTFRSTVIPATVNHMFENYLFAEFMGFNSIYMTPNNREKWTTDEYQDLANQLKLIFDYRIEQFNANVTPITASFIDNAFENVLLSDIETYNGRYECPNINHSIYRCGLGTGLGSIAYDGNIYGCQEQPSKDDKNIFLIGNIFNGGIDKNKHSKLLKKYWERTQPKCENENGCLNCKLQNICTKFSCPSTSWDLFKNFHIISYTHCMWLNMLNQYCIDTMKILVDKNNQTFKEYLDNNCNFKKYWKEEEN